MEFPIVIQYQGLIIKLFNWMDYPDQKPARNVEAFDQDGKRIWIIESLTTQSADCYTNIKTDGKTLTAFNFVGYDCVVDPRNGKIISSQFTK